MRRLSVTVAAILVVCLFGVTRPAIAQSDGKVEIGASLANVAILTGTGGTTIVGVPSATFSIINPGVYFSIMAGDRLAIEPQIGFVAASGGGHLMNAGVQIDGFLQSAKKSSPYIFGGVGVMSGTGLGSTPMTFGGGVGERFRFGDRLTMRLSGQFTRVQISGGGGNMVFIGVWIGGLFGK